MKHYLLAILLLLSIGVCLIDAAPIHRADPEGSQMVSRNVPLPTTHNTGLGILTNPAAFAVGTNTATLCPTLATGTKSVRFYVYGTGDVNIGDSAVGSDTTHPFLASGALSIEFSVATTTPTIYFIGRSGAVSYVRPLCW